MENREKNSFLITCGSCIVLLMVLCYFGTENLVKDTYACTWDPSSQKYVGSDCFVDSNGTSWIPGSSPEDPTYGGGNDNGNGGNGGSGGNVGTGGGGTGGGGSCSYDIWSGSYKGNGCVKDTDANGNEVLTVPGSEDDVVYNGDGSVTINNEDTKGTTVSKTYTGNCSTTYNSDECALLATVITDKDGESVIKMEEFGGEDDSAYFYTNKDACEKAGSGSNDCVYYANLYFNRDVAQSIMYHDLDVCESVNGADCKCSDGISSISSCATNRYIVGTCPCGDTGDCVDEDYIPKGVDDGDGPVVPDIPNPNKPSNPSNPDNPSNPETPDENVDINPPTGEITFFIMWVIGLMVLCYSVWYFLRIKKEN